MEYAYYPGCSLEATALPYNLSTKAVAKVLDLDMQELEDWNCCGATSYMSVAEHRAFVMGVRNLALAQQAGAKAIVAACSACYLVLHKTNHYFREDDHLREVLVDALAAANMKYDGKIQARHFLDVIVKDVGQEKVEESVKVKLEGLRVAPYYGCQYSRPFGDIDDPEQPMAMDNLFRWIGAEPVPYPVKTKCCGGMLMTTNEEIALKLNNTLLTSAEDAGADCIATACPLCQINVEAYQSRINRIYGTNHHLPVVYFTQVLGVALGCTTKELGLGKELGPRAHALASFVGGRS
jgi:heterodisulfide reductase subunit B2